MNEIVCARWNEWDGLWAEGNKNETWSMKCGLKEIRWNMNNEVDNVTSPSLSSVSFFFYNNDDHILQSNN